MYIYLIQKIKVQRVQINTVINFFEGQKGIIKFNSRFGKT